MSKKCQRWTSYVAYYFIGIRIDYTFVFSTKKEDSDQRVFSKSVEDAVISNENTVTTCKVEIETTRQKQENENQCSGRPDVTNLKDAADLHKR